MFRSISVIFTKNALKHVKLKNKSFSIRLENKRRFSDVPNKIPPSSFKRGLLFTLPIGFGLYYSVSTFNKMEKITNNDFADLLEKGEIQYVLSIDEFNKFVALTHSKRSDGTNYVHLNSISSREELINFLSIKEAELKIPSEDRIQIISFPFAYTLFLAQKKMKKIVLDPEEAVKLKLKQPNLKPNPEATKVKEEVKADYKSPSTPQSSSNPILEMFGVSSQIKPSKSDLTFKDVVGLHASKQEVIEFVDFLKKPEKFTAVGAKLPKGALLLGPPGCGKTLLVKALSNEAEVPFFEMAGSEFVEVIGGLGAKRIRDLFKAARKDAPAIIFIDEIDSIGRVRSTSRNTEMEQTLNQLLVEMDGIETTANVILFAATNRADLLDKALLRAGRFDRHIYVDLPNLAERRDLFELYVNKYKLDSSLDKSNLIEKMAGLSAGMSGADISQLCNEAALITARRENFETGVTKIDFEDAFEKITMGPEKRTNSLSSKERHVSAIQVAGKTIVSWFMSPLSGKRPVKASLLPRAYSDGLGGFIQIIPEDKYLLSYEELCARISVMLGGRAAEQLELKLVSDASHRQLKQATDLAFRIIQEWGMSNKVGHVSFETSKEQKSFGTLPYSQKTQSLIEQEATLIVSQAFHKAMQIVQDNRIVFDQLVKTLLEKEVLSDTELEQIFSQTNHHQPME